MGLNTSDGLPPGAQNLTGDRAPEPDVPGVPILREQSTRATTTKFFGSIGKALGVRAEGGGQNIAGLIVVVVVVGAVLFLAVRRK